MASNSIVQALGVEVARLVHRFQADGPRTLRKVLVVCGFLVSWKAAGALAVPLVLYGLYKLAVEIRWARRRGKVLAESGLPAPSLAGSMKAHKLEWSRARRVRKQWDVACTTSKLTSGSERVPPTLLNLRADVNMDLLARIKPGELGISVERILKHSRVIAETIGCREVVVTQTTIGCADLTFMWTEAIQRTLPVSEVPKGPRGTIAYGIRRDGFAATVVAGLPILVSGMTGSGKSGFTWSCLGNLNLQNLDYWLYASDPKGGVELGVFKDKPIDVPMGPLTLKGYATDVEGTAAMIDNLLEVMKKRQADQPFRKWTVDHAKAFPLIVFVIDESVEVMKNLKPEYQTKLLTVISQIRASGGMIIALTQMAQKDVMGAIRDMFPQRISLAQRNAIGTDMALGDGAEAHGARCSEINLPSGAGTGFSYDETRRGYELFRAGWCSDADIERIASGLPPIGMGRVETVIPKRVAVYRVYDRHKRLLYVGVSDAPGRRLNDEHSNPSHKDFKPWWNEVDPKLTLVIYEKDDATAKAVEWQAIQDEWPLYNDQGNRQNPTRVDWRRGEVAPEVNLPERKSRNPFAGLRRSKAPVEGDDLEEPVMFDPDEELAKLVSAFPAYVAPEEESTVEPAETSSPELPVEEPAPAPAETPEPASSSSTTSSRTRPSSTSGRYSTRRQASPETLERARLRREAKARQLQDSEVG